MKEILNKNNRNFTPINGFCVYDAVVVSQMIEKLLQHGLVTGKELCHVAALRTKVAGAIEKATGIDINAASSTS
jgi:hypothetical protein